MSDGSLPVAGISEPVPPVPPPGTVVVVPPVPAPDP
jgi:hypothetical protein